MSKMLPLGKRYTAITICILLVGTGLLAVSSIATDEWFNNVAIEFGATLILFAPLLLLSRAVENRMQRFAEEREQKVDRELDRTNENVASLATEVTQTREEVRGVREELSQAVVRRLTEKRAEDRSLFDQIEEDPTRERVANALIRANDLGLVARRGPRVSIAETDLYARFALGEAFGADDGSVEVCLEYQDGSPLTSIRWARDLGRDEGSAVDVLVELSEKVQAAGQYPGDAPYQAGAIFADLRRLLDLAYDRATGANGIREPIGPVVEIFPPQWALTETTLKRIDGPYDIAVSRFYEMNWWTHVVNKPWIDEDSFNLAFDTAKALYESAQLEAKPPGYVEEPPF